MKKIFPIFLFLLIVLIPSNVLAFETNNNYSESSCEVANSLTSSNNTIVVQKCPNQILNRIKSINKLIVSIFWLLTFLAIVIVLIFLKKYVLQIRRLNI